MSVPTLPTIHPDDTARTRLTDPPASHHAADISVKRVTVARAIERALDAAGKPLTADQIWHLLRDGFGFYCSRERVRTVLNEGAGLSKRESVRFDSFRRLDDTAPSDNGNPACLWTLAGAE